jgi:hypothetical protein
MDLGRRCAFLSAVFFASVYFFFSGPLLISAQTPAPESTVPTNFPPKDELKKVVLGVAEFRFIGTDVRDRYFGKNVARLFLEKVLEIKTHNIGSEEESSYAEGIIAEFRRQKIKEIDGIYLKRDALLFSSLSVSTAAKFAEYTAAIDKAKKVLSRLADLPASEIVILREKELAHLKMNTDDNRLLPPVLGYPAAAAAAGKVDYLLWGTIEAEAADYFTVSAYFFGSRSGRILYSSRAVGQFAEMDRIVDGMFQDLAAAVTGREWACLSVSAEPKDAGIFVDGTLIGIGKASLPYTLPGTYRVLIQAAGYETIEEEVILGPFRREKKAYTLPVLDSDLFYIGSVPPGAKMYLGSLRMGDSPLTVPDNLTPQMGRLELEGYKTKVFPYPAEVESKTVHVLPRNIYSWEERIETKRSDFYRALGWFILSIPFPVLLNGLYETGSFGYLQYTASASYDRDTARGMAKDLNFLYYSYFGSLFISGSLLFNAVIKLFDYIRVGEESQRYPDKTKEKKD